MTVRWESAAPMMAATHLELPETFAKLYAISITGLPPQMIAMALNGGGRGGRGRGPGGPPDASAPPQPPADPAVRQKEMVDKLLHSVTLSAKNRDPQSATMVMQTKVTQALIFGFEKISLPLTGSDKEVLFTLKLGMLTVKVKFEPRDMTFDGQLAV